MLHHPTFVPRETKRGRQEEIGKKVTKKLTNGCQKVAKSEKKVANK